MRRMHMTFLALIGTVLFSGCITVDPYWDHEFDGVGEIQGDTIRLVSDDYSKPTVCWIAIRASGLEDWDGWILIRFEHFKANYDTTVTTESHTLQAWLMKTPRLSSEKGYGPEFEWWLPDRTFSRFRNDPNDNHFRDHVLKLKGRMQIRGDGDTVHRMDVDLKSEKNPMIRFKGSVIRRWHLFRINVVLI